MSNCTCYNNPLSTSSLACPRVVIGANTFGQCVANGVVGYLHNYQRLDPPFQCPMDENLFLLGAVMSLFGIKFIKKSKSCMMM